MTNDELNRIMATAVMGWHSVYGIYYDNNDAQTVIVNYWNPATDANDSLRVVETMRAKGWAVILNTEYNFVAFRKIGSPGMLQYRSECKFDNVPGIPRAICESAAKAVGVKP
jgi:hypothetical protein